MQVIDRFQGEYSFLSNFHPAPITFERIEYPTVEHAFQAAKKPISGGYAGERDGTSSAEIRMEVRQELAEADGRLFDTASCPH